MQPLIDVSFHGDFVLVHFELAENVVFCEPSLCVKQTVDDSVLLRTNHDEARVFRQEHAVVEMLYVHIISHYD